MENTSSQATETTPSYVIFPEQLLEHWQGHRWLTRRLIEIFPEKELFTYAIGGMRPFSELVMEMIGMAAPGIEGVVTGEWSTINAFDEPAPQTKSALLHLWDQVTEQIHTRWPQIPPQRFQEVDVAFGQYEGQLYWTILYFIDNEIHHRGQAYVYLRSLAIEPPAFWDRS